MIVYVDSSALVKRVIRETESDAVDDALAAHTAAKDAIVSSALAWIEVERAVRAGCAASGTSLDPAELARVALSGIAESSISAEVVSLARRLDPPVLRSHDAIHLATAILVDADRLITYDDRLITAAKRHGVPISQPRPA